MSSIINTWGETNTIADLYTFKRDILFAPFLIHAFLEENRSNNQHVREVYYENLVQNQEEEVKALYEWFDIPYDSSVLDYSKNDRYRGLMGDQVGIQKTNEHTDKSIDAWQEKFTDTYWGDFFKGYAAFLGKEFLSSYGNYSNEFVVKNIHETPQFQKFKYFSEDKLIDINFVDSIKDYKRYDLTARQLNNQNKQIEHQQKQLRFQMEQFEQQKERECQQREKEKQQLEQQKRNISLQEDQLHHQENQLGFQKEQKDKIIGQLNLEKAQNDKAIQQLTKERDEKGNVLRQLKQEMEKGKKVLDQLINEKDCALRQMIQDKEQKEKAMQQIIQEKRLIEEDLKRERQEKDTLHKSLSWRITAPLRKIMFRE